MPSLMNEAEIAGLRKIIPVRNYYTATRLISGTVEMDPLKAQTAFSSSSSSSYYYYYYYYYLHAHIINNNANLPLVAGILLEKATPHT